MGRARALTSRSEIVGLDGLDGLDGVDGVDGVDARRLLSMRAPLVGGRDIHARGHARADAPSIPRTGAELIASAGRIGFKGVKGSSASAAEAYVRGVNFVSASAIMYKNTGAAYRGHLGFRENRVGKIVIVAFCTYGFSDDLDIAVKRLNAQLQRKLGRERGKYMPDSNDPSDAKVSVQSFIDAVVARDPMLGGVSATF
jgi:hypothetical protein